MSKWLFEEHQHGSGGPYQVHNLPYLSVLLVRCVGARAEVCSDGEERQLTYCT
jgi:hypothetical protein